MGTKIKRYAKRYYKNGKLECKVPYIHDELHGVAKWYYENGELKRETPYIHDELHGVAKEYDENGGLLKILIYENGVIKTRS